MQLCSQNFANWAILDPPKHGRWFSTFAKCFHFQKLSYLHQNGRPSFGGSNLVQNWKFWLWEHGEFSFASLWFFKFSILMRFASPQAQKTGQPMRSLQNLQRKWKSCKIKNWKWVRVANVKVCNFPSWNFAFWASLGPSKLGRWFWAFATSFQN